MSEFTRSWTEKDEIDPSDIHIPVRQVYVWLLTTDERVVIVSKDGKKWQLPGGKPEKGESLNAAAVREVDEETGIDISEYADQLKFFGYYTVNEPAADPIDYLQVRYLLSLPLSSDMLDMHAEHENANQAVEDVIRHVGAVGVRDVASYIPWMPTTEEYQYLMNAHLIKE